MKKQITLKRLYNIALFYLSKYEASRKQVGDMLNRRVLKARLLGGDVPAQCDVWIQSVLDELEKQHYLSDDRFAENRVRHWSEQGKSDTYITMKLKAAGVSTDVIQSALQGQEGISELERARQYVIRKRIGFMRPESERGEYRQKDLAKLARQGFSLDVAKQALAVEDGMDEYAPI